MEAGVHGQFLFGNAALLRECVEERRAAQPVLEQRGGSADRGAHGLRFTNLVVWGATTEMDVGINDAGKHDLAAAIDRFGCSRKLHAGRKQANDLLAGDGNRRGDHPSGRHDRAAGEQKIDVHGRTPGFGKTFQPSTMAKSAPRPTPPSPDRLAMLNTTFVALSRSAVTDTRTPFLRAGNNTISSAPTS